MSSGSHGTMHVCESVFESVIVYVWCVHVHVCAREKDVVVHIICTGVGVCNKCIQGVSYNVLKLHNF